MLGTVRVRLGEKDWPDYERGDEWCEVDPRLTELDELSWDALDEIEQAFGGRSVLEVGVFTARHLRMMLWVARRRAGIVEPFARFKPNVYRYEWDTTIQAADESEPAAAGDADPPAPSTSADRPPEESVTAGQPRKRSTSSTRRSRASTT